MKRLALLPLLSLAGCTVVPTEDCTVTVYELGLQAWTLWGEIPPGIRFFTVLGLFILTSLLLGLYRLAWSRGYRRCLADTSTFLEATTPRAELHLRD